MRLLSLHSLPSPVSNINTTIKNADLCIKKSTGLLVVSNHFIQEAQLMLANHATRLEVSQGHQTWYHLIC